MVIHTVRFRSALSDEEVLHRYEARSERYRAVPGLVQKYYMRFRAPGEHGAVYVWESQEALDRFRESELARSIAETYEVMGEPHVQVGDVVLMLGGGA